MDREPEYLLQLLGACIRGEKPPVFPDVNWKRMTELARIHNVAGILGYMTMTWPVCPDGELRSYLRGACLNTIATFANRAELAERFSRKLAKAGIDHIVMKGFVLRRLYPVPELRTFGDIDMVIRPGDREKSHKLMLELGFEVKEDWEPVFSYRRNEEFYEIHTRIMEVDVSDRADYQAYFRDVWAYARQTEPHRFEFKPEYHFLYLLTHIAKHVTGSGAGIRMYLDVAAFLRHYGAGLDWAWVEKELEALALADFANAVLTLVEDCVGIAAPIALKPVEEQVREAFVEFTLAGGVFGTAVRDEGTNSLKKESREHGEISRTGTLVKRLFPPAQSIQERYTYLQKNPWLLPAAWVHRLVITKDSWRRHAQEAQDILGADKDEVRKLNRLYRDIGL